MQQINLLMRIKKVFNGESLNKLSDIHSTVEVHLIVSKYRTRAIITRGLYTFYPLFEVHLCTVTFGLMYGYYSRAVYNQERVIVARVRYINIIVNLGIFILASGKIWHHNIIFLVKLRAILFQNSKVQQNSFRNR